VIIDPLPAPSQSRTSRSHRPHRRAEDGEPLVRPDARLPVAGRPRGHRGPGGRQVDAFGGRTWHINKLQQTTFLRQEDPNHSGEWVAKQINNGAMAGFVSRYIEARKNKEDAAKEGDSPVMGYLSGEQLPVYDYLGESPYSRRWDTRITWRARSSPRRSNVRGGPLVALPPPPDRRCSGGPWLDVSTSILAAARSRTG
jgi:hypothetical protein